MYTSSSMSEVSVTVYDLHATTASMLSTFSSLQSMLGMHASEEVSSNEYTALNRDHFLGHNMVQP